MGAWIERDLDIEVPADPVDLDTAVYSSTGGIQVTHERAASQVGQCHWRKTACTKNRGNMIKIWMQTE